MTPSNDKPDRPLASPQAEQELREHFPFQTMSPEEYAARNAADIACFSLDRFRYADRELDSWIQRVAEFVSDWTLVNECRKKYLTADEMRRAIERDKEAF